MFLNTFWPKSSMCSGMSVYFFVVARQLIVGHGLLIVETSWSNSVGLLFASDQPEAEISTWTTHNTHERQTSMSSAGFETAIPTSERQQTHVLDRAATGIGKISVYKGQ
jgi:hypothetical protein